MNSAGKHGLVYDKDPKSMIESGNTAYQMNQQDGQKPQQQGQQPKLTSVKVVRGKGRGKKSGELPLLDQLYFGKTKRHHVKEFGALFGAIFAGISAYLIHHGYVDTGFLWLGASLAFAAAGYLTPKLLYPLWSGWMSFAHALGMVMSFVFVAITWVVVAIPIAFLLRIIGKKVMDLSFDRSVQSYWEEREDKYHDFKLLERQF